MKKFCTIFFVMFLLLSTSAVVFAKETADETRAKLNEMSEQVLERMKNKYPETEEALKNCYAYCTISGASVKYGFFGGDHGRGIAVNKVTGKKIYMKMKDYSVGLSVGAKEFDLLFIIDNEQAWDKFISGSIKFGTNANATATDSVNGDTYSDTAIEADGIYVYQLDSYADN